MLILLPPSEGKSVPHSGPPLDLDGLPFPELRRTRRTLVTALTTLCRTDPAAAASALGLGPRQADEVTRDARLRRAPCAAAIEVYSGVVFDSLGYATMSRRQQHRADDRVVIASALWGLVRPTAMIPAYRLSGGTTLPGLGTMRRVWHDPLGTALSKLEGLVLDLRSGAYCALAPMPRHESWVSVRVFHEHAGRRTIVSHHNKATKGLIARAALTSAREPTGLAGLQSALTSWGYRVERERDASATLDVIVS